jgi:hypothetical protein
LWHPLQSATVMAAPIPAQLSSRGAIEVDLRATEREAISASYL